MISAGIYGISTINHKLKVKHKLTNDQYVVLDFIAYWRANKTEAIKQGDIRRRIGMEVEDFKRIKDELLELELLEKKNNRLVPADAWTGNFNFDKDFDEFWLIFNKKGNRAKAKTNYMRCRNLVDKDKLHKAAEAKVRSQDDLKYLPHASTWLNPLNRHWEDEIESKDQKKVPSLGNFLKTSV